MEKVTLEAITAFATVAAVIVSLFLALWAYSREELKALSRYKAHKLALLSEIILCKKMADGFIKDFKEKNIGTPLYRLPTLVYSSSFAVLMENGKIPPCKLEKVMEFYNVVESFNRGHDEIVARFFINNSPHEQKTVAEGKVFDWTYRGNLDRIILKAEHVSGKFFSDAESAIRNAD